MNFSWCQKAILIIYAIAVLLLCLLYVPYRDVRLIVRGMTTVRADQGLSQYAPIWQPPPRKLGEELHEYPIDGMKLVIELFAATIVAGVAFVTVGPRRRDSGDR